MTYDYYISLVADAAGEKTEEFFIGEIGYPADINLSAEDLLKVLHIIYTVANGNFKDLQLLSGLNQSQFARKFNIPLRTIQNWCAGSRQAPTYVNQLIGYALVGDVS